MADGDGLQVHDGNWLRIRAAAEPLMEVKHADRYQLARLAWHLGSCSSPSFPRFNLGLGSLEFLSTFFSLKILAFLGGWKGTALHVRRAIEGIQVLPLRS